MSEPDLPLPGARIAALPPEVWERLEQILGDFEAAWQRGARPDVADYLAGVSGPERAVLLTELACEDLEFRLQAGEAACAEDYLRRFPELAGAPATELILAECLLRRKLGGVPDVEGLGARFPDHAEAVEAALTRLRELAPVGGRQGQGTGSAADTTPDGPAAANPARRGAAPAAKGLAIPGYEVLEELGRGGMGVVYKARQRSLNRLVALKMLLHTDATDVEALRRFRAEAEALARLRHPNIVAPHDVGECNGQPYFTMEYVAGGSLAQRLEKGLLLVAEAARLVEVLARAVAVAHRCGIVHRDLKPANVLLEDGRPDSLLSAVPCALFPKITDFGLAKNLNAPTAHTRSGTLLGTPAYMAPEQADGQGNRVGPCADIYALGAVLYELLTGRPPFVGEDRLDVLLQVRMLEPVPPGRLRPRLPRDLEVICLKCLQKRPADRYPTAAALADDLRRFLDGVPIRARPPSAWRRTVAWARRRRVTAALLVSGLVLTATMLGGLLWHTARLSREQGAKEQQRLRAREAEHASRLRLADQAFRQGDRFVLAGLLDKSRPASPEEEDLRGFEWYRLTGFRHPPWRLYSLQGGSPAWIGYSPDGRWLGVGRRTVERVEVWDAATGKLHFQAPLPAVSRAGVFGPAGSGWLAVAAGTEVTCWDLQTGRRLGDPIQVGHEVQGLALHPDGRLILGGQGPLMAWTPDSGLCPVRLSGGPQQVNCLSVNPNGKSLAINAINSPGRFVAVWDLSTGKRRPEPTPQEDAPGGLAYSPRGSYLWYVSSDLSVRLLHEADLEPLHDGFPRMPGGASAVAFSPGEKTLATGGPEGLVRFWDVPSRTFRGSSAGSRMPFAVWPFLPTAPRWPSRPKTEWFTRSQRPFGPSRSGSGRGSATPTASPGRQTARCLPSGTRLGPSS
jgi:tRNA A-37 threonylcarbamoyl transferase component Bud32